MEAGLEALAQQWLVWDPNAGTREELSEILRAKDAAALRARLGSRLEFGTAGLRGPMGCGSSRMNDLTVIQASQGLCQYVLDHFGDAARERGVVIGYDHRALGTLNSETFGLLTAAAFLSKGVRVHLFRGVVATPLVPFGIVHKGCVAGVMVTASHNPKQDNGYKVYWSNGSQIIPPHDAHIAAAIERNLAPWEAYDTAAVRAHALCADPTEEVGEAYIRAVSTQLCRHAADNAAACPKIAYTAMHGVGHPWVRRMFAAFSLPEPVPVAEQVQPDPAFPTVAFPNPEEGKGALALACATADREGARLVLANDPDADRLAVAEKEGSEWRIFTGNELGVLLGYWQWREWRRANPEADASRVAMLASTVSSKMLGEVARQEGFRFHETLTGFKWMGNRAEQLETEGSTVLFSFEEAIGFCVGSVVRDKDGVSAAAVFAEMAGQLAREGLSVAGQLRKLYDRYGHFVSNNSYVLSHDPAATNAAFARIRNEGHYWLRVGGHRILHVRDLGVPGVDTSDAAGQPSLPTSAGSHMVTFTFANGSVLTLRTSGTEPKIKWYSELRGADAEEARALLGEVVTAVVEEMLQPERNGFKRPALA